MTHFEANTQISNVSNTTKYIYVQTYLQIYLNFQGQHLACLYMKRVRVFCNSLEGEGGGTICEFQCLHIAAKNLY
jgi:hypothetical protein